MLKSQVKIVNELGLHARAAAQLVRLAGKFESNITLIAEDKNNFASAKSILSILTLAASLGTILELEVDGNDETAAQMAIEKIFEDGFGELN